MKYPCEYVGDDVATYGTQLDAVATSSNSSNEH